MESIHVQRATALLALSSSLSAISAAQAPPAYRAEFLGTATFVAALNESGTCVGWTSVGSALRGWVAGPGSPVTPLPLPPGRQSSMVNDVNSAGVIVGTVGSGLSPEFSGTAAAWIPDGQGGYTVVELGALPGHSLSHAVAINDLGDVVGTSHSGMFAYPVLFTAPGGPQDLSPSGLHAPKAVNDLRVVVDESAQRLDLATGALQTVGLPPPDPIHYVFAFAYDLNDAGQIAATVVMATSTDCDRKSALHTDGSGWLLLSSCGQYNEAYDVNDLGDVVFRAGVTHYVHFAGLGSYLIQGLIVNETGTWYTQASFGSVAINDGRQIAISASNPATGQSGIVLLSPITDVGTQTCYGDGTAAGACPCGNASAAGSNAGCLHSGGSGAVLAASGSDSVAADDLVLGLSQAPPAKTAMFLQGGTSGGVPFRDGLLCVASPTVRLQVITTSAAGAGSTSVSIAAVGGVSPGSTRNYQAWFRDPFGPCGQGSNLSSAVEILWQ